MIAKVPTSIVALIASPPTVMARAVANSGEDPTIGADLETLFLFAILFGLVDYSTVPVTASLVASHIGLRVMGLAFGLISAGHQIGGALGAYFGGILFDIYARYDWVWWSSLWLAVLAGLLVFLLRNTPRMAVIAD